MVGRFRILELEGTSGVIKAISLPHFAEENLGAQRSYEITQLMLHADS